MTNPHQRDNDTARPLRSPAAFAADYVADNFALIEQTLAGVCERDESSPARALIGALRSGRSQ